MNDFLLIKVIVVFSLISISLSYNILLGKYIKDSFASRDDRFNKAYTLVNKNTIDKTGGPENAQVFPIAVYRQVINGLNYKIITVVKDEKNQKVNLVDSIVYTGPFSNSLSDTPTITYQEKLPNYFNLQNDVIYGIEDFISTHLLSTDTSIVSIDSIVNCPNVVENESFYLVYTFVIQDGVPLNRYFVLSYEQDAGITILHSFDFPI